MLNKFFSYNNSFFMIKKLFIFLFLSINGFLGERIPGVAEIDQYDDPMLDEIFKETNSDIQKSENVASSIIQPQQQSLQTFNSQNQHQLPINSEKLNSAASSVINPNIKPPPSGSSFPTEFNGQQQQNAFGIFQNPYGGGFNQYNNNNNNIFARTPLTDFAYQAGQTFYSGVKQASRLLGIDSGQYQPYEVPLLSQSTRFFGKRK